MIAAQDETDRKPEPEITKDEYKDMVNTYGLPKNIWVRPDYGMPGPNKKQKEQHPLAPRLVITPEQEHKADAERVVLEPIDDAHADLLDRMYWYLRRHRGTISLNTLWKLYYKLPRPRLRYMDDYMIRAFFSHLTWTEHAHMSPQLRRRYFMLLEHCVGEKIRLTPVEWSAAMHLAGRAARIGTDSEVKDAIELWLEMEQSGVPANRVVFNVLFDVAVKAGRYALADTIINELRSRGLELDRYFRMNMIYYAGAKGDGDAVRKAFNDMVNAGEIIDTSVMNCVILSFLRSGEPAAAEHVFMKMNALHASKFSAKGPSDWRKRRRLASLLNKTGQRLREEREKHESSFFGAQFSGDARREQIQEASPVAPDALTYRLLIRYHTRGSGDLDRVQELLAEKKERGFHVHGSVYLTIFSAFIIHGGYAHSAWTPKVLESFWKEFLEATSAPQASESSPTNKETTETSSADAASQNGGLEASSAPNASETLSGNKGVTKTPPVVVAPEHDALGPLPSPNASESPPASKETTEAPAVDLESEVESLDPFDGPQGLLAIEDEEPGASALSEEHRAPYFTLGLVVTVLRAFHKCKGTPRVLEVWDEIKSRWKECGAEEITKIESKIEDIRKWDL